MSLCPDATHTEVSADLPHDDGSISISWIDEDTTAEEGKQ